MRAPSLDDVVERTALVSERGGECLGRLREWREFGEHAEPDGRGNHVIGGLRHVDVIIRMHGGVGAARVTEPFVRKVGEHLVDIHVVRGARTRLIHVDHELLAMCAGQHFVGGRDNGIGEIPREPTALPVGQRRRPFDLHHGIHERRERLQAADRKILERAQRLNAVERARWHLSGAQRVALYAHRGIRRVRHQGEVGVGSSNVEIKLMYCVDVVTMTAVRSRCMTVVRSVLAAHLAASAAGTVPAPSSRKSQKICALTPLPVPSL